PTHFDFGTLIVGQSATQTVQVANLGEQPLSGSASASSPFSILAGTPYNLVPGQTGQVTITFSPNQGGSFSNVLVFQSNGGNITNLVSGTALTPGQLATVQNTLDFGLVDIDAGTNATGLLTLTNFGGASLGNVTATIDDGPFALLSTPPFALPGFGSTNILFSFTPSQAGSFSNLVQFASDSGNITNTLLGSAAFEPVAAFTGNPTTGLKPLTVTFTDTSQGTITNWTWF